MRKHLFIILAALVPLCPQAAAAEDLNALRQRAIQSFLTHQPGQSFLDQAVPLGAQPSDPQLLPRWEVLRVTLVGARDAQEGCALPCTSPAEVALYATKLQVVGTSLAMSQAQLQAAVANYIPQGVPRKKRAGSAGSAEARAIEAQAVTQLLSNPRLPPSLRESLNVKALALADALGKTQVIGANGQAVTGKAGSGGLSKAELDRLNAIPQAQAAILRRLVSQPPPTPDQAAIDEFEKQYAKDPGTVGSARKFWHDITKDPDANGALKAYAYVNRFLLDFTLAPVEKSAAKLGWLWDNTEIKKSTKFWAGAELGWDSAMAFLTFLPVASVAKGMAQGATKGATAVRTVKAGAAMTDEAVAATKVATRTAEKTAARKLQETAVSTAKKILPQTRRARLLAQVGTKIDDAVRAAVRSDLEGILTKTLKGAEGKMTGAQFNQMYGELIKYAEKNGIKIVKEAGTMGVYPKGLNKIAVSQFGLMDDAAKLASGGYRHELAHMFHAIQARVVVARSVGGGGKITGTALKEAEQFVAMLESGGSYRNLEKAVTAIATPAQRVVWGARDVGLFDDGVRGLLKATDEGLAVLKVRVATGHTLVQAYAAIISKGPIFLGKSFTELVATRMPLLTFATLYATNTDISCYGADRQALVERGLELPPGGVGMRDLVKALINKGLLDDEEPVPGR